MRRFYLVFLIIMIVPDVLAQTQSDICTRAREGWNRVEYIWDEARQQAFHFPRQYDALGDFLYVYDCITGEQIAVYNSFEVGRPAPPAGVFTQANFAVTDDFVLIYRTNGDNRNPLTIWDRTTQQIVFQINIGTAGFLRRNLVALSPDQRYLAIGFRTLRVWDLMELADSFDDRTATYQYLIDSRGMNDLIFVDERTVRIFLDNGNPIQMDILTGERTSE